MEDTQKGSRDRRKLIERYWAYMGAGEFAKAGACMAADAAVWFPNTREVFQGRDTFVAFNQKYPGKWSIKIEKLVAVEDTVITVVRVESLGGETGFYAVSFFTVRDGLIQEITEYWGENSEPPEWRIGCPFAERY